MSNGFLSLDPIKDPANNWRNAIGVASLIAGVGLVIAWQIFGQVGNLKIGKEKLLALTPKIFSESKVTSANMGGDIVAPPPEAPKVLLPLLIGQLPSADSFTAEALIVKDDQTGAVLFGKNEYQLRPLASITKLMSALVVLEKNPDWNATTTVVVDDISDTHMYAGDTYTLAELWQAALVGSSNKAIMTLADAVGWPRVAFVERMNDKAHELGMVDAVFTEPTGLDDGNVASASDLALLLNEALRQDKIKSTLLIKEQNLYSKERKSTHHLWNTDWLMLGWINNDFASVVGKTGYTVAAGYNFATQVTTSDGRVIDAIVLGANKHEARFTEARDVINEMVKIYQWPSVQ